MNDVNPNETQSSENNVADHVAADDTTHNVITGAHKFAPQCDDSVKPCEGKIFQNLVDGINFYKEYARICGFQIRKATSKKASRSDHVSLQYIYCNRQGFNIFKHFDSMAGECSAGFRRRASSRTGCKARVVLKRVFEDAYVVKEFIEEHNHPFTSPEYHQFLKSNRSLNYAQQNFVMDCGNLKIGARKSHRILKELSGGYANVGAQVVDVKNFKRDFKNFVGSSDAQIIIDKLRSNQQYKPGFSFEFCVGTNGELEKLFWADTISKNHFAVFGDCVAFDATYRTNKYNLVFIPFTGVDNNKSCVTFAAGLLLKEDVESYSWLLEGFRNVMGRGPDIWVTDQDPAMKIAIKRVFPESIHRLCMWHISKKFTEKIGSVLCSEKEFLDKLDAVVWNRYHEPAEFEDAWKQLIDEYGLHGNKWLSDMFDMRQNWIPAFFRDVPMGGLLRTTSRSESENSFFNCFLHSGMTLTEFFLAFETAMDAQRHNKHLMDHESSNTFPACRTSLHIEKHAAEVFTRSIFLMFNERYMLLVSYAMSLSSLKMKE